MPSLSDVLLMIASGISVFSLPVLFIMVYRLHRKHVGTVNGFQFDGAEDILTGVRESHVRLQKELEDQLRSAEPKTRASAVREFQNGLELLGKAREASNSLEARLLVEMWKIHKSYKASQGDTLNLIFIQEQLEKVERLRVLFDDLEDLDRSLLKSLGDEGSTT